MNTRFLTLAFLLLAFKTTKAQELPEIIPPSPRAQSFHIYGDIPVNYNTGVPNISIPLYTMRSNGMEIPITLRYHTASLKPLDPDMNNIAYGWILDCGGRISRSVMGVPDEQGVGSSSSTKGTDVRDASTLDQLPNLDYPNAGSIDLDNLNSMTYIENVFTGGGIDTEYDRFNFNFAGHSGKFYIDEYDNVADQWQTYFTPYQPWKVQFTEGNGNGFQEIDFTDVNGMQYAFGGAGKTEYSEATAPTSWLLSSITDSDDNELFNYTYDQTQYPWGRVWHNEQDAITLNNEGPELVGTSSSSFYYDSLDSYSTTIDCYPSLEPSTSFTDIKTVERIDFAQGSVDFDVDATYGRITGFTVKDQNDDQVLRVSFVKSTFLLIKTKLDAVKIYDKNDSLIKEYTMSYDNDFGSSSQDVSTDYWGYMNGNSSSLCGQNPTRSFNYLYNSNNGDTSNFTQTITGISRTPTSQAYRHTLTSIGYPTGGSTHFEYELNEYETTYIGNGIHPLLSKQGGGFRIHKIVNKDTNGQVLTTKEYEYEGGSVLFDPDENPNISLFTTYTLVHIGQPINWFGPTAGIFRHTRYPANPLLPLDDVRYRRVKETQLDESSNSNGSTTYFYDFSYHFGTPKRTEMNFNGFNLNISGDNFDGGLLDSFEFGYFSGSYFIKQWRNTSALASLLKKKIIQDKNNDTLQVVTNTHVYTSDKIFNNLKIDPLMSYHSSISREDLIDNIHYSSEWDYVSPSAAVPEYFPYNYTILCQDFRLSSTTTENYFGNDKVTTTESYTYDPVHRQLKTKESVVHGKTLKTEYYYPYETFTGNPVTATELTTLQAKNLIGLPVLTNSIVDNTLTKSVLTDIGDPDTSDGIAMSKPLSVATTFSTNAHEENISYDKYSASGKLLQYTLRSTIPVSYIWGYNEQYPIAKIENATFSQVESAIATLNSAYDTLSEIQTLSNVDNDHCLDTHPSGCNEKTLRTALNDLINALSDALVTTYTYDPLVGVTSVTDPKGYTIYYEYDAFNRLKQVKDADGKILSQNDYHYKGQQ